MARFSKRHVLKAAFWFRGAMTKMTDSMKLEAVRKAIKGASAPSSLFSYHLHHLSHLISSDPSTNKNTNTNHQPPPHLDILINNSRRIPTPHLILQNSRRRTRPPPNTIFPPRTSLSRHQPRVPRQNALQEPTSSRIRHGWRTTIQRRGR